MNPKNIPGLRIDSNPNNIDLSKVNWSPKPQTSISEMNSAIRSGALQLPRGSVTSPGLSYTNPAAIQSQLPTNYLQMKGVYDNPNYFVSTGNESNPLTGEKYELGQVVFEAPDYLVNTQFFKNKIEPILDKPVIYDGKTAIHDVLTDEFRETVEDAKEYAKAVNSYITENNGATEDDAIVYLQNIAAANTSNNDNTTQVAISVNKDGSERLVGVKDLVDTFNKMSDESKGSLVKNYIKALENPDLGQRQKAIISSLLTFANAKKLLGASGRTQLETGLRSFLANADSGGVSALVNRILSPFGGDTIAEEARKELERDPRTYLNNLENARGVGGVAGNLFGVGADIVAGAGVGGAANAALRATRISRALDSMRASGNVGRAISSTIRETPANAAIGGLQTAGNDQNFTNNFLLDTAITGAMFGVARGGLSAAKALDTASNGTLSNISNEVSKFGLRALDKAQNMKLIGGLMKKFSYNFVDDTAGVTRVTRKAFERSKGAEETKATKNFYYGMSNALRQASMRGFPEAQKFLQDSSAFQGVMSTAESIGKFGNKELEEATKFTIDSTILSRIESGQYKASEEYTNALRSKVQSQSTPEFERYRQQVSSLDDEITALQVETGITDEALINEMKNSPEFADQYIALQADIERPQFNSQPLGRSLKGAQAGKKIKGFSENTEYLDPLLVAYDRLRAVTELASRNQVTSLLKRGIDNGWISGEVIQDALKTKERAALKRAVTSERKAIDSVLDGALEDVSLSINRLVDDIEDALGDGVGVLSAEFDKLINNLADNLAGNEIFISRVLSKLPEGTNARSAAVEALSIDKKRIGKKIEDSLSTTELGKTDRTNALKLFNDRLNQITTTSTKAGTTGIADKYDELRRLRNEISPDSAARGNDVLAYFQDGGKGYIRVSDPDILDYFNMQKSPVEDGWIARLATGASRLFRLGTTGINPRFLLVNAARDIPQSAIASGVGVLSPRSSLQTLMEVAGLSADEAAEVVARNDQLFETSFKSSTEYSSARNPEKGYKALQAADRKAKAKGAVGSIKRHTIDALHPTRAIRNAEDVMSIAELATRKNVFTSRFDAAIRRGQSVDDATQEALFYASEATANFLRRGARIRQIIRTMPYLSAAINGKASFMRLWALDPIGVTARLATGIVAPVIYLSIANLGDEETAKGYFEIPDYTRETNMIIMTGPDSYIAIPMSYELASVVNPFREMVEKQHGMNNNSFQRIFVNGLLNQSPIDMSGFTEQDFRGNVDVGRGVARLGASVLPQIARPLYETTTGTDLYTGQALGPTDEELIRNGQVDPNSEITDADRTFRSRNSRALGFLANAIGIPQSTIQNVFKNYTGAVGQYALNALDKLTGAPEEAQGGRDFGSDIARTFGGQPAGRSQQDFYRGIDRLQSDKELLMARLSELNSDPNADPAEVSEQRQALIDQYGKKVGDFASDFGEYYQRVGGVRPYQADSLIRLLNFAPDGGTFDPSTYQNAEQQQSYYDARNDAMMRARQFGIQDTSERDLFGQTRMNDEGLPYTDWNDASRSASILTSIGYGTPKQAVYEFEQAIKGDKKNNVKSLSAIRNEYYDILNPLFAKAKGLKGKAKQAVYDEITAIQYQYNAEVLQRLKPVFSKYGVNVIRNNRDALEAVGRYIMVPGDVTPFAPGQNKQPYMTRDAEAYIKDLLGVGELVNTNIPTDKQVTDAIRQSTLDIDNGKRSTALYRLNQITNNIDNGRLFADYDSMEEIKRLIELANKR